MVQNSRSVFFYHLKLVYIFVSERVTESMLPRFLRNRGEIQIRNQSWSIADPIWENCDCWTTIWYIWVQWLIYLKESKIGKKNRARLLEIRNRSLQGTRMINKWVFSFRGMVQFEIDCNIIKTMYMNWKVIRTVFGSNENGSNLVMFVFHKNDLSRSKDA